MSSLPQIRKGLLRHQLDEQVLVYDSEHDRIHLLDQTSAHVLKLLEKPEATPDAVVSELAEKLALPPDPTFLTLALDQLQNADLLDEESAKTISANINRRDMVNKLAAAGIASILIPAIATLGAPKAYAQSSQVNLANGSPCTADYQCASGICNGAPQYNNTCQPCQPQGNTQGVCNRQLECCVGGTCRPDNNQKCA